MNMRIRVLALIVETTILGFLLLKIGYDPISAILWIACIFALLLLGYQAGRELGLWGHWSWHVPDPNREIEQRLAEQKRQKT